MLWSWQWEARGPAAAWFVGALFFTAGMVIALVVPPLLQGGAPAPGFGPATETVFIFRLTGWSFVALGGVILAMMAAGWHVRRIRPADLPVWHWWVGFVGGLLGALMFAVPAALTLPFLYVMSRGGPGGPFPEMDRAADGLWIGVLFSLLGLAVLVIVGVVARLQLASRPRWSGDR